MGNNVRSTNLKGEGGFKRIADTAVHEGPFECLLSRDDATMIEGLEGRINGDCSGDTLDRGERLYGHFTSVQLTAGVVYAYYAH